MWHHHSDSKEWLLNLQEVYDRQQQLLKRRHEMPALEFRECGLDPTKHTPSAMQTTTQHQVFCAANAELRYEAVQQEMISPSNRARRMLLPSQMSS